MSDGNKSNNNELAPEGAQSESFVERIADRVSEQISDVLSRAADVLLDSHSGRVENPNAASTRSLPGVEFTNEGSNTAASTERQSSNLSNSGSTESPSLAVVGKSTAAPETTNDQGGTRTAVSADSQPQEDTNSSGQKVPSNQSGERRPGESGQGQEDSKTPGPEPSNNPGRASRPETETLDGQSKQDPKNQSGSPEAQSNSGGARSTSRNSDESGSRSDREPTSAPSSDTSTDDKPGVVKHNASNNPNESGSSTSNDLHHSILPSSLNARETSPPSSDTNLPPVAKPPAGGSPAQGGEPVAPSSQRHPSPGEASPEPPGSLGALLDGKGKQNPAETSNPRESRFIQNLIGSPPATDAGPLPSEKKQPSGGSSGSPDLIQGLVQGDAHNNISPPERPVRDNPAPSPSTEAHGDNSQINNGNGSQNRSQPGPADQQTTVIPVIPTPGQGGQPPSLGNFVLDKVSDSNGTKILTDGGGVPSTDNRLNNRTGNDNNISERPGTDPGQDQDSRRIANELKVNDAKVTEVKVDAPVTSDAQTMLRSTADKILEQKIEAKVEPKQLVQQLQNTLDRETQAVLAPPQRLDKKTIENQGTNPDNKKRNDETDSEWQLRLQFTGNVASAKPQEADTDLSQRVQTTSINRLEMKAAEGGSDKHPVAQFLSKLESTVETKIQSLLNVMSELGSAKPVTTQEAPRCVSPGIANAIAKQDLLPFLPNVMRMADISIGMRRVSTAELGKAQAQPLTSFDPNGQIPAARKFILGEAMSLKDFISASKGEQLPPGFKGGIVGDAKSLSDPSLGIKGMGDQSMSGGKIAVDQQPGSKGEPIYGPDGRIIGYKGVDPNALEDGDDELIGKDRKDTNDQNDDEDEVEDGDEELDGDEIGLLVSDKKKGKKKDTKEDDKSKKDDENNEQEARRKYIVQAGDTLESIAQKVIGDSRFSSLLEMINRGSIRYHWEGAVRKPLLRVGQVIWLPTRNEVKVHTTLFFTKRNSGPEASNGNDSVTLEGSSETLPAVDLVEQNPVVSSAKSEVNNTSDSEIESTTEKTVISFAPQTDKNALLPSPDAGSPNYSTAEWLDIQNFLNNMREAAETGRVSKTGFGVVFDQELPLVANDNDSIKNLDALTRIVVDYEKNRHDEDVFIARLERQYNGKWTTVSCYENCAGRSVRYMYRANGSRKTFKLNIPDTIVREMALKDFNRNWKAYSADFERIDAPKPLRNNAAIAH